MIQTSERIIEFWVQKLGSDFEENIKKGSRLVVRISEVAGKQTFVFFPDKAHGFCGEHRQFISKGRCFCGCKDFEFNKKPCKHLLGLAVKIIKNKKQAAA